MIMKCAICQVEIRSDRVFCDQCVFEEAKRQQSLAAPETDSSLTEDLARAVWSVLNHDNDENDIKDPCHKENWENLKRTIASRLRARRRRSESPASAGSTLRFEGVYALEEMVKAAVIRARPRCYGTAPRWVAVRDAIGYGSTTSTELCRHFGLDPEEQIEGWPKPSDDEPTE